MNNVENSCCICLNNIENDMNIINCERCVNIICINCFEHIEKKIDINYLLCYTCPTCKLEVKLNLEDYDIIKKYNLSYYFKKLIILQNNTLHNLEIKNHILQNKVNSLLFCTNNSYKLIKMLYIIDKLFITTCIGVLYLAF